MDFIGLTNHNGRPIFFNPARIEAVAHHVAVGSKGNSQVFTSSSAEPFVVKENPMEVLTILKEVD